MAQYGKTWWGKKWLEAFNGIDYSNRLPRGKTYANKGAVHGVEIQGTDVTAKVEGSRRRPYEIQISQKKFSKKEKNEILEVIHASPAILSRLINRELPESLLEKLLSLDIRIFPQCWEDLDAECSCPDWALPCKHLAAAIYLIANKIDRDPFLVFELHDFDLLKQLQKSGLGQVEAVQDIVCIEAQFSKTSDNSFSSSPLNQESWSIVDLSLVTDLEDKLQTILKPEPIFYDKDFKKILFTAYRHWKRQAILVLHDKSIQESNEELFVKNWGDVESWSNLYAVIGDTLHCDHLYNQKSAVLNKDQLPEYALVKMLADLPTQRLNQFCESIRFWHLLNQFIIKLISCSAFVPQIMQNKQSEFMVSWSPALFDVQVNQQFKNLCTLCPPDLIHFQKQQKLIEKDSQTFAACSLLFNAHLQNWQHNSIVKHSPDLIIDLFFNAHPQQFDDFEIQEVPRTIHLWLSRLFLGNNPHQIHLLVEELDEYFSLDIQVSLSEENNTQLSLEQLFSAKDRQQEKLHVLADLALLCEYLPDIESLIDDPKQATVQFHYNDFTPILMHILPVLRMLGVRIILPKSLQKLARPQLRLDLSSEEDLTSDSEAFLKLDQLLKFDWKIAIGDKSVDVQQFKQMLQQSSGIVRMLDQYVLLDDQELKNLLKQLDKLPDHLSNAQLLQAALGGEYQKAKVQFNENLQKALKNLSNYQPVSIPNNLKATLRPYQESGFSWMVQNTDLGFGSLIADDMGLGKTLQVIAALLHFKNLKKLETEKVLIVAPTTLLSNWRKEIERFAPTLDVSIYHGQTRSLDKEHYDILITSYGLARRDKAKLNKLEWFIMVIDEAQHIKNPQSEQTKSINGIKASHYIAMSGTPVENRLLEYWSIFDFTNKHYLGPAKEFKNRFANPIEKERDQQCLETFQRITRPFILRRLKSDKTIIQDLPDKIETDQICSLSSKQTALYQEVVNLTLQKIESSEGIERKGLIFKLINALKQICNHPAQYLKNSQALPRESGKLQTLMELLTNIDEQSEKTLIFTQYTQMGNLLTEVLTNQFKHTVPFLHGGLSVKKRDALVDSFQNDTQMKTLIISLKAGGTGLNLTAANHVIHYDLWWNPAVEAQATDRAYRIGQNKNVMVYRLLTENTFEEKINDMLNQKKDLANLTVASGEKWLTEFSDDQLKELVSMN